MFLPFVLLSTAVEVIHMTTVESLVTEIGLTHPIVCDIYDLCDYVKEEKLNCFTVSMLKEICTFFEFPFKSTCSTYVCYVSS